MGLVTYNDAVKTNEALSHEVGRLQEVLDRVKAVGGGDMPEGADKALDVALELKFGWRRDAAKTVVVLGDAPPHPEDMDGLLTRLKLVHEQVEITVNTVSTGAQPIAEFERIAKATGGQSLSLKDPSRLVGEVLLLIFGERLRPAMERFVPVLLEVLEAQDGGA